MKCKTCVHYNQDDNACLIRDREISQEVTENCYDFSHLEDVSKEFKQEKTMPRLRTEQEVELILLRLFLKLSHLTFHREVIIAEERYIASFINFHDFQKLFDQEIKETKGQPNEK